MSSTHNTDPGHLIPLQHMENFAKSTTPNNGPQPGISASRLIHSFPKHDTLKLNESNFIQWQQHLRLIIEGYVLTGFMTGTQPIPLKFVPDQEGKMVLNLDILLLQEDKLLVSWVLFTISASFLSCFTGVCITSDV